MRASTVLLVVAALGVTRPVSGDPLRLQQAIAMAMTANADIRAAAAGVAEAREGRTAARAAWLPRIDLQEGFQRGNQPVYVFGSLLAQRRFTEANFVIDTLNAPSALDNHRAAFTIEQSILDVRRSVADVRAANATASLAASRQRQTTADVRVAVTEAYTNVIVADTRKRTASAAIEAALADQSRAQARRAAGTVTEADALALDVHLAQIRAHEVTVANDALIARATLNRLIGVPLETSWELAEPFEAATDPRPSTEPATVTDRPDVVAAALQVQLARAAELSARSAFVPTVILQGGYEWNGRTWGARSSSWVVGLRTDFSLSFGGGEVARLRAAEHAVDRARAEAESTTSAAALDVRSAVARLQAARARRMVGASAVAQARESERIIRDRYGAGLATVSDLLRAAQALLDAESLAVSTRMEVVVAAAQLERAQSSGSPDDNVNQEGQP